MAEVKQGRLGRAVSLVLHHLRHDGGSGLNGENTTTAQPNGQAQEEDAGHVVLEMSPQPQQSPDTSPDTSPPQPSSDPTASEVAGGGRSTTTPPTARVSTARPTVAGRSVNLTSITLVTAPPSTLRTAPEPPLPPQRYRASSSSSHPSPPITNLPLELLITIIRQLDFSDMEQLRRTCRFFHTFVNRKMVQEILGKEFQNTILSFCYLCLSKDMSRRSMILAKPSDPRYPFASKCVRCAFSRGELTAGCRVSLGNFDSTWVCRWCGYPVSTGSSWSQNQFHAKCRAKYSKSVFLFFMLGCIQFCLVVVGIALCLQYYRQSNLVLAPCVTAIIVSFWPYILNHPRGLQVRTYHWSLLVELILLCLWIPPVYHISTSMQITGHPSKAASICTLVFCGLNMVFRLLNTMGNLVLASEFQFFRYRKPAMHPLRRAYVDLLSFLVLWTYPNSLEQDYVDYTRKFRRPPLAQTQPIY